MPDSLQSLLTRLSRSLGWLRGDADALSALTGAVSGVIRQVRTIGVVIGSGARTHRQEGSYETLWLDLVFDIADARGEHAVLTRRQRVRFLTNDIAAVRELVWGEGEQLVRYGAQGARRLGVRAEGSKRAVLLDPVRPQAAGDRLTITSRRTIRAGFRGNQEYCEAFLERPTGRLDFTVVFPSTRPPREARLVAAATEQVLRTVPVRYGADGRAVLRCQVEKPVIASTYSLRWSW